METYRLVDVASKLLACQSDLLENLHKEPKLCIIRDATGDTINVSSTKLLLYSLILMERLYNHLCTNKELGESHINIEWSNYLKPKDDEPTD